MTNQKFPTDVQIVHDDFTFADLEEKVKGVAVVLERKVKESEHNVDEAVLEAEAVVTKTDADVAAAKEAVCVSILSFFLSWSLPELKDTVG
jgi:hypothetical protein